MKANTRNQKILRMVEMAMLIALVVVLQILSTMLPKIGGTVAITLTLVPIVVGGILLGKRAGAILGFAFSVIVVIMCVLGLDPGGNILWTANPPITALLCILKGVAAGFFPALIYKALIGKNEEVGAARKFFSTLAAAVVAPVANTSLFVVGMFVFFKDTLYAWAGGSDIVSYVIIGLAGVNFLVELAINIILSPAIVRIVDVVGNKFKK